MAKENLEQDIKSLEERRYKSKRHKEMVEDFIKKDPIVECLYGTADSCYPQCPKFYDCWVKGIDGEDIE